MFCCSWTTYLEQLTCQSASLRDKEVSCIQKTTENIHVSDGLYCDFFLIATYKYSYLLTYLLSYLLTYLLQYAPVVIMSEVHKRNQYRPLPAVDSVRSFSSVCSHQLTLARKVLRKRCMSHTNRVLKNFLRTAQHLPVPPARTHPSQPLPTPALPTLPSIPFPGGGHPLYSARGPGERCRLSQRVRPPNDYCCTWS